MAAMNLCAAPQRMATLGPASGPSPRRQQRLASGRRLRVAASSDSDVGAVGTAAIAAGLVANPVVLWSEYTLKTTGAGLPPGPGGALGALEGVSYLVIVGVVAWSAVTKAQTGSGLPAGPAGLLGAVEGFSYLALLGGIVVAGLNAAGL